jgi:uncharacterized protein YuzE
MEIKYDAKTDMMYIRFNHKPLHSNVVVADDSVVIDLAEDETVIGIELISPSRYVEDIGEIIYRHVEKNAPAPAALVDTVGN